MVIEHVEKLREGFVSANTLKYKIKGIMGAIVGAIISMVGIAFMFSNVITGIIILAIGLAIVGLSYLSIRSSRRTAEIEAGMHGTMAKHRLMDLRRRNK